MDLPADADRWQLADRLFDEALDLAPEEREAFLDRACGGDPELRAQVRRLLVSATGAGGVDDAFLAPGGALDGPLADELADELTGGLHPAQGGDPEIVPGSHLGRYQILSELGRGGMAVVYLAERADGDFRQQVAVKVLRRGQQTAEIVRRFHRERQILAQARHPAIARLLDAGTAAGGRPYVVLEYVDGLPIDRFADERRLTVRERLRLFLRVARAVEYAHRNLVVHRDIKPSNLLVTADGDVKLLDFGIAKLLDETGEPGADPTRTTGRVMTPAYASPEQVRGVPVTTATDIYQLGLLLHLLLAGAWPYRSGGASDFDLAKAILADEPTRPSSSVVRAGDRDAAAVPGVGFRSLPTPEQIARARGTSPSRLARDLSGDLDNVVLKALRKEPERRYPTVGRLIDDVERFLDGRPVGARPDTFGYRLSKFVRRHTAAVAVAGAMAGLVVALVAFYTVRLSREAERARREAAKATEVSRFLTGLFEVAAPTRARGEKVTARELLDRGAERISRDLAGQPEVEAALLTTIGGVYRELALYDEAGAALDRALGLRRASPGDRDFDLAATLVEQGRLHLDRGEWMPAEASLGEALALREAAFGPDHPAAARVVGLLGSAARGRGDLEAAKERFTRAVASLERALPPDHPDLAGVRVDFAALLRRLREYEAAGRLVDLALPVLERTLGESHPRVAEARLVRGDTLRYTGRPEEAEAEYRRALPQVERVWGEEHPEVADALTKLGNLVNSLGRPAEAREYHERALAIRRATLGPDHVRVADALNNVALTAIQEGRDAEAARLLEQAVAIYEAATDAEATGLATFLGNLGDIHARNSRPAEALALYERVLAIRERAFGPDHSMLARRTSDVGWMKLELGDPAAAEPDLRRGLALGRPEPPHLYPEVLIPRIRLAACVLRLGRPQEAEALLAETRAQTPAGELPVVRFLLEVEVELYDATGRPEEAARARAALAALPPPGPESVG